MNSRAVRTPATSIRIRQRGVSLIAAVFLITALAALTAGVVLLTGAQHGATTLAYQQMLAYQGAQAGAEWAAFTEQSGGQDDACDTNGASFTLSEGSLAGVDVAVACTVKEVSERPPVAGTYYDIYTLTVTATIGTYGGPDYAQRTVVRRIIVN
jgi:Tfp pilus assembly protein PilX